MKLITKQGLTIYFMGVEVAGIVAWFVTALILFCGMWLATEDLFASLFFPIWMITLFVVVVVIRFLCLLFKRK